MPMYMHLTDSIQQDQINAAIKMEWPNIDSEIIFSRFLGVFGPKSVICIFRSGTETKHWFWDNFPLVSRGIWSSKCFLYFPFRHRKCHFQGAQNCVKCWWIAQSVRTRTQLHIAFEHGKPKNFLNKSKFKTADGAVMLLTSVKLYLKTTKKIISGIDIYLCWWSGWPGNSWPDNREI